MDFEYESVLLVKKEVFLYSLPPRQSTRGYRAADWSLNSPAWTGRLRIVTKGHGKTLYIKLEDATSGKLYAQCPVDEHPGVAVEQVLDSSRYFVIRLMSDDGRTVFVGIGFAERSDSFDFNLAIQDHFKQCKQAEEAEKQQTVSQPSLDLGLKEGQRLRLNINTRRTGDSEEGGAASRPTRTRPLPSLKLGNPTGVPGLIPPPPPSSASSSRNRQYVRGSPNDSPAHIPSQPPQTSQPTSNVDLLAGVFQAPPTSTGTVTSQNPNDWSLI
ncbi:unnamed protein product [Mesocestoides corti]|uniref:DUF1681 domain-containing protein n=1 Tax=Mesocestoides corti TaxID=53468 RepID=A0A0R3U6Z6_MESCO|nr:unnamed protein product [Mesocestoides corti]